MIVGLQEQAEQATMKSQIGAVQTQVDQLAQQVLAAAYFNVSTFTWLTMT